MSQPVNSKRDTIIFWIVTGLFGLMMLSSAIPNILQAPEWVTIFNQLGYPQYMLPFLGVAKLLGVITILIPGFNRLKEWAYAGLFFDLVGATYSALAAFPFDPQILVMLVFFGLGALSYVYHHKRLSKSVAA